MPRARLTVAYDGTRFHGFAPNDGVETVVGTLRDALSRLAREPVELTGAGRTDAGVHGWGQVVSVDLPAGTDLDAVQHRVNRMLGPTIVIRDTAWVGDEFDARFSARWRHYRYHVWTDPVPNPFNASTAWFLGRPLDLDAMRLACDPLIGEHDFGSFCRKPKVSAGAAEPSLVRRVLLARWGEPEPSLLRFEIRANAFCHQMVRSIVGLLVEVGEHKRTAGEITTILRARDRAAAGRVAPPHGLVLWEVGYDGPATRRPRPDAS